MDPQLLFATAVTPSLLLLWFFHARDHHPEPRAVLLATFFLGVVIVIPVLALAFPLASLGATISDPYLLGVYHAFAVAAIPEELCKLMVVWFYCARHKAFDEPMDGVVYGAVASLGFASLENLLYVAQGGAGVALLRAFTAVPSHAFWGVIMGYYVGQAKFGAPERRGRRLLAAYVVPVLLHGLYDAPVLAIDKASEARVTISDLAAAALAISLVTLIVSGVWAVRAAGGLRRAQAEAIAAGIVVVASQDVAVVATVVATRNPARNLVLGLLLLLVGGAMTCVGGFLLLGVVLVAADVGDHAADAKPLAIALAMVMALVPLVLGVMAFRSGLRRM